MVLGTRYGNFNTRNNLTKLQQKQLEDLTSHGLAKKTWASYKSAERLLIMCCKKKHINLELPLSEETIITFILYLAFERNSRVQRCNY